MTPTRDRFLQDNSTVHCKRFHRANSFKTRVLMVVARTIQRPGIHNKKLKTVSWDKDQTAIVPFDKPRIREDA